MRKTRHIMGMPITVEVLEDPVAGAGRVSTEEATRSVFEYFEWVDRTFSTFKPESPVSRLNRGEITLEQAPPEVRKVLQLCEEMKLRTGGYFDIRRPDNAIDPSGLVKGWAIGEAGKLLDKEGVRNYCIEAGGDVWVRGHNEAGESWRVGIRNPLEKRQIVKTLGLRDMAVATSGNYERGEHIYNPHTGKRAAAALSVTVVGPDICTADVYATAAFALGTAGVEWAARQGLECYQIGLDGEAVFTPGLVKYFVRN